MIENYGNYSKKNHTNKDLATIFEDAQIAENDYLDLSQNNFSGGLILPDTELPHLKVLDISKNKTIIEKISIKADNFPALQYLFLFESQIENFEIIGEFKQLNTLHLAKNNLIFFTVKGLPDSLEVLYLFGNKIQNFGKETWDGEDKNVWDSVRAFFKEINKGIVPNTRVKLILVGNGRVGKTSMTRRLCYEPFNKNEDYTHGIRFFELNNTHLPDYKKTDTLQVRGFDFGGQELFYAMHQFFFSENALYILAYTLHDVSTYQKKQGQPDDKEVTRKVVQWLENIELLTGEKRELLVVRTHTDECTLRETFPKEYREKLDEIDFCAANDDGLVILRKRITQKLEQLSHLGNDEPITYENVIKIIEKRKGEGVNEITLQEFKNICAIEEEDRRVDEGNEEGLLKLLHERGIVLWFGSDESKQKDDLRNTVYINPEYLVSIAYGILNISLYGKNGKFREEEIADLLKNEQKRQQEKSKENDNKILQSIQFVEQKSPEKSREWLSLLLKFKLIFQPKKKDFYIAPQFLPEKLTEDAETQLNKTKRRLTLSFVYHFPNYMPDNLTVNFLSEYGPYSDMIFWRSGINFTKNDRDYIIEYAEKDKDNEKEQCFWVYSAHEAADNEVLCEILTSFRELSRNASSEIAVPKSEKEKGKIYAQEELNFVPFGKVKSAVKGKSEKIYFGNDDENEILTEKFLFFGDYFFGEGIHKGFNECADLPQNIKIENNNTMTVRDLITNGRLEKAIEELLTLFKGKDKDIENETVILASSFNRLKRERMMMTNEEARISENRITSAALDLCTDYEKYYGKMPDIDKVEAEKPVESLENVQFKNNAIDKNKNLPDDLFLLPKPVSIMSENPEKSGNIHIHIHNNNMNLNTNNLDNKLDLKLLLAEMPNFKRAVKSIQEDLPESSDEKTKKIIENLLKQANVIEEASEKGNEKEVKESTFWNNFEKAANWVKNEGSKLLDMETLQSYKKSAYEMLKIGKAAGFVDGDYEFLGSE